LSEPVNSEPTPAPPVPGPQGTPSTEPSAAPPPPPPAPEADPAAAPAEPPPTLVPPPAPAPAAAAPAEPPPTLAPPPAPAAAQGGPDNSPAGANAPPASPAPSVPVLPPPDSPFAPAPETPSGAPTAEALDRMPLASGVRMLKIMKAPPKAPPLPLLQAEGLVKRFGKREVVSGVNLEVGAGEVVGLLGRNGAGKTTTFRMIVGMLRPDHGTVRFAFHNITRLPMYQRANRGLGYLAQEPSVFQRLTVEENLLAVLELQIPERQKRLERLEELIRALGLQTVRKGVAATLSGGERRRLEIARAMTLKPKIVLFDEPFSGIDPIAVAEIQDILRDLKAQNVGILLTDHNVRETLTITDRTYIMDEGKIWIHGSPREIVNHPEARERYLGQGFRLDF